MNFTYGHDGILTESRAKVTKINHVGVDFLFFLNAAEFLFSADGKAPFAKTA